MRRLWKKNGRLIGGVNELCDLALEALGPITVENVAEAIAEDRQRQLLESVRSEALVEPSPEQWQEFYDRVWDSDETNPALALPTKELQRIGRALIAALQSPARVAEDKRGGVPAISCPQCGHIYTVELPPKSPAKEQPGERHQGKYRLVYNKVTKKIDKISNFDGLAVESFDPPTDCDFTLPPPPERP